MAHDIQSVRGVLKGRARSSLQSRGNVVATGVGYKVTGGRRMPDLCIVCSVQRKLEPAKLSVADLVPKTIDGIPTDVVESGRIRALQGRTGRHRPMPGGISIGHRDITAGTLGCLVRKGGSTFILSNNHVLANSNDAQRGDPILQPGPHDGGRLPGDHVADLDDFVPISFLQPAPPSDCPTAGAVAGLLNAIGAAVGSRTRLRAVSVQADENRVDAAIARPLDPASVKDEILEIGAIQGVSEADLGTAVKKSGRTTGLTTGEIQQVDVTVDVDYGGGRRARFVDQLLAGAMSQGGDSGSAVLDAGNRLVGLLFAGSDTTTVINRIQHVLSGLGVTR